MNISMKDDAEKNSMTDKEEMVRIKFGKPTFSLELVMTNSLLELSKYIGSKYVAKKEVEQLIEKVNKEWEYKCCRLELAKSHDWDKEADYRIKQRKN